ncbi:biotin--[acetyl-CoA-carboxylase] ligase [Alkaliphilus crotonatoxidans]
MKEQILKELYNYKDGYLSGEELANRFGVTRTAIWKHINSLKEEGYQIETLHKKGYRLLENEEKMVPTELLSKLKTQEIGQNMIYLDSIDSTNNYAKKIALEATHGTIVITEEQVMGRGRLGRGWKSPKGQGIWMSLLLKPSIPPTEGAKLTQIAAASVCLAIRHVANVDALIKWPNDIVIRGKKVCGILTEMAGELNEVAYLIVGMGINVNIMEFPEDLREKATSLRMELGFKIERTKLIIEILNQFELLYQYYIENGSLIKTVEVCRQYSALLGKKVRVIQGQKVTLVKAIDITEEGLLKVVDVDGRESTLLSGEISVRGEEGYV